MLRLFNQDQKSVLVQEAVGYQAGATTHRFADIPIVGLVMVVILAVGGWILEELRAVFRRPTIVNWNPRRVEVQEALHLVAGDSILRLAIQE